MSTAGAKLRRVVVMLPNECETARYACGYVAEFSDMGGDIDSATGRRAEKARDAIDRHDARRLDLDVAAIDAGIEAIQLQCSCVTAHGRHAAGCYVQLHDRDLDRLLALRAFLAGAP